MSYILEALRKAEQERSLGSVPGIDASHEPTARARSGRWIGVLVLVLLINAALLTVLLWPQAGKREPVVADKHPATQAPAQQTAVASAGRQGEVGQPLRRVPTPTVPVSPQRPQMERRVEKAMEPVVAPAVAVAPPAPAELSRPSEIEQRVAKAVQKPPQSAQLPVWPQVPEHLFQAINAPIHLDVHVYSDQARDRFVLINLQKFKEGEQLQEGPRLDEITPDGVILSYRGQRFRVQAQ